MDTPVSIIYAESIAYFANAIVVLTIRDPYEWLRRRNNRHHERAVMCRRHMMLREGVRHPFDLPGCLRLTEYANQAIEHVQDADRIIDGYRKMNAYNAAITPNLHVMCLWDTASSGDSARSELLQLWSHYHENSS